MAAEEFAPAKVNLALHVTGRRADGYHLLDSLVVFAGTGDRIRVEPGPLSLSVTGPRAAALAGADDNLVLRAARLMGAEARITLEKHLPVASGIGGGSSDAAAALRALARLTGRDVPGDVLSLGADVPVCLAARPARMRGIGEDMAAVPALPPLWLLLVNPGQGVATPAVFAALDRRDNPPMHWPPETADAAAFAAWLSGQRNDLELPARRLCPAIDAVLSALGAQPECLLARMSGSGATCFGLFAREPAARAAETALRASYPGWWSAAAPILS